MATIPSGKVLKRSGRCRKPTGRSQSGSRVGVMKVMASGFDSGHVWWAGFPDSTCGVREKDRDQDDSPCKQSNSFTQSFPTCLSWMCKQCVLQNPGEVQPDTVTCKPVIRYGGLCIFCQSSPPHKNSLFLGCS